MEISEYQFGPLACTIHGEMDLLHSPVTHPDAYFNVYEYEIFLIHCHRCGLRPWWTWLQ